jgi:hypothetical protein
VGGPRRAGGDPAAHYVRYELQIQTCVLDSPDMCLYYYHLLRGVVFKSVPALHAAGLGNIEFSGADLNPYSNYLPENLWIRILSLGMEQEEVSSEEKGLGTTITGALISDGDPGTKNITLDVSGA